MRKLEAVENDTVVTARKEVERVDRELIKWRRKLAELQEKVGFAKKRETALGDERTSLVLLAKAEGNDEAEAKLDKLSERAFKVTQERGDLDLAVSQINEKILGLETQHEAAARAVRMEELRSLGRKRLKLAQEIETSIEQAVSSIEEHLKIGQ